VSYICSLPLLSSLNIGIYIRKKQQDYSRQLASDAAARESRSQPDAYPPRPGGIALENDVAYAGLVTDKRKKQEDYVRALQADASRAPLPVEFISNRRQAQQPSHQQQQQHDPPVMVTQSSVASIGQREHDERTNKRIQQQQYAAMLQMQQANKPTSGYAENIGFDALDHHLGPGFSKPLLRRQAERSVSDETDPYYHLGDQSGKIAMIGAKPGSSKEDKRFAQARYAAEIRAAAEESAAIKARSVDSFQLEKRRSASTPRGMGAGTSVGVGYSSYNSAPGVHYKPLSRGSEGLSGIGARADVDNASAKRAAQIAYYEQLKRDEDLKPIPKERVLPGSARRTEDPTSLPVAGRSSGIPSPTANRQRQGEDSDYANQKRDAQVAYRQALEEDSRIAPVESSRVPLRGRHKLDDEYVPPVVDPNLRKMVEIFNKL